MSAAFAAAAAAVCCSSNNRSRSENHHSSSLLPVFPQRMLPTVSLGLYESQKRRDWNTFVQYMSEHYPRLVLSRCTGAHVLEFLKYLDQFGKTKVHTETCPFFGQSQSQAPCPCPLRQAWGSLDALIRRLSAVFEENGWQRETNPFVSRPVRLYLVEVRDLQAKARGVNC